MASLYIDFGYDDNVKRSINSAKRAIDSRISDYNGIINKLNNTSSETSNLDNASYFVRKKRNKLQDKLDKLNTFHGNISEFNEYAEGKDKKVADRIKKETNQFYKRENIKTGLLYTIGSAISKSWKWIKGQAEKIWNTICTTAKAAWEWIKDFYEKHKYLIDVIVDSLILALDIALLIAGVAATIATGGALAPVLIFGIWGIADSTGDLVYDSMALHAHNKGDDERAEELSKKGLKNFISETCKLGKFGELLYHGMNIASFVYDVTEFVDAFRKAGTKLKVLDRVEGFGDADVVGKMRNRFKKECFKTRFDLVVDEITGIKHGTDPDDLLKLKKIFKTPDGAKRFKFAKNTLGNIKLSIKQAKNWFNSETPWYEKITKTSSAGGKIWGAVEDTVDIIKIGGNAVLDRIGQTKTATLKKYYAQSPLYCVA